MEIREELRLGRSIYDLPLKVCYYARVSTDHELQLTSIVNQVAYFEKCINNCEKWKLVGGYVDEGISGKDVVKRENFLRMIEDGKRGSFDLVLTKSVSRFARNTIDSIKYTDLLLSYGIGVLFLNDNINTFCSDSEFRLTLMASIAQDELRKLSESVRFGLKQSIERGVVLGNSNILGYRKERGKLVIVEEEAEIVREIFSLFVSNRYSYKEVGRLIYKKYGRNYDSTGIRRILTNYKYKGFYCGRKSMIVDYKRGKRKQYLEGEWVVYRDYEKVPPLVEEKVWDWVQVLIKNRSYRREVKDLMVVSLKEKVICGKHNRRMVVKRKRYKEREYYYFVCTGCCSLASSLLRRIVGERRVLEILVWSWEVNGLKLSVKYLENDVID